MTQPIETGPDDIDLSRMSPAEADRFVNKVIDRWTMHGGDPVLAQELADMDLEWL